jgi:hypothetical protein
MIVEKKLVGKQSASMIKNKGISNKAVDLKTYSPNNEGSY